MLIVVSLSEDVGVYVLLQSLHVLILLPVLTMLIAVALAVKEQTACSSLCTW